VRYSRDTCSFIGLDYMNIRASSETRLLTPTVWNECKWVKKAMTTRGRYWCWLNQKLMRVHQRRLRQVIVCQVFYLAGILCTCKKRTANSQPTVNLKSTWGQPFQHTRTIFLGREKKDSWIDIATLLFYRLSANRVPFFRWWVIILIFVFFWTHRGSCWLWSRKRKMKRKWI
jgi:hypothetical protein